MSWCTTTENALALLIARTLALCPMPPAPPPLNEPMKVIVVGMSKTGTVSMKQALDKLGYKTFHHTELITPSMLPDWVQHARDTPLGQRGNSDTIFNALAREGYNATTDAPLNLYWREALRRYPQVKFILTLRPGNGGAAQYWYSWFVTVFRVSNLWVGWTAYVVPLLVNWTKVLYWMSTIYPTRPEFQPIPPGSCFFDIDPLSWLLSSKEAWARTVERCAHIYDVHNDEVRRHIPSSQMLIYSVDQGFAPLCKFLDVKSSACPESFPKNNEADALRAAGPILLAIRFVWLWLPCAYAAYKYRIRKARKNKYKSTLKAA